MPDSSLKVLSVIGSLHETSATRSVILNLNQRLEAQGCSTDTLDLSVETLELLNPNTTYSLPNYAPLKERVLAADVLLLGTPDYHGSMSGALKNFFDHFWKEFAGKLFAPIVASHEKGLTVTDQIRTVARQCYAWAMPYAVSFVDKQDIAGDEILDDAFEGRLEMFARDIAVYGKLLSAQRSQDLSSDDATFMARYR